jgi:hypothetical protein
MKVVHFFPFDSFGGEGRGVRGLFITNLPYGIYQLSSSLVAQSSPSEAESGTAPGAK